MGLPSLPLRQNPPRALLAPRPTTTPHRPLGWALCSQDTILPLTVRQQQLERKLLDHFRLSDLLDRAQRPRPQRAVRTPHQELCRERSDRPAERSDLRTRSFAADERQGRPSRRSGQGPNDAGSFRRFHDQEGLHLVVTFSALAFPALHILASPAFFHSVA